MTLKSAETAIQSDWADRSEYWRINEPPRIGRRKKFNYREPLILCGHGARIRVDHGSLLIRNGFTHYPQKQEEFRLFPGDAQLPDRIVLLDVSGGISFDALSWLADQRITLVQLNWRGHVAFIGSSNGYSADRKIADAQFRLKDTKAALELSRLLTRQKINNSISTLRNEFPADEKIKITVSKLNNWLVRLDQLGRHFSISSLLGIEGAAAATYFQSWHGIPLNWSGLNKRPIPADWSAIGPRTMTWRKNGVNARHPVNAMLNYCYALAISELRGAVIAAGLDPSIGFVHSNYKNRIPLVYDLMEPMRPLVDSMVLRFVLNHTFTPNDCAINRVGACRLNPQLASALARTIRGAEMTAQAVRRYMRYIH